MKYSKDFNKGIGFAHVGADAYKVSDVWKLGSHIFKCDGNLIFRINFFRTKKRTYYFEAFMRVDKNLDCCLG